jgi:cell division protein FtsI (penicillin-binding protein 3)
VRRPSRIGIINLCLFAFALALVGRAAWVQLWQGNAWAARAVRQHFAAAPTPAPRGDVLDATGARLAESREMLRIAVAPREVRETAALRRALANAGVPAVWIARASDRRRAWVAIPGRFAPLAIAPALALRGVYAEPVSDRVYAATTGMRAVIGRVDQQGKGIDGLELTLDSLLRGRSGAATMLRDARGRRFESPGSPGRAPTKGHAVSLTLNAELQAICERALADAVAQLGASGGDIVVLDPHDGAVLAMASRRGASSGALTALTEPFEPGSTVKPLVAAALLARGHVAAEDVVPSHGGRIDLGGRVITDVHKTTGRLTLTDVIRFSSNVGIVQFAQRFEPREQFEAYRDFGFGTPTGILFPSEAAGSLHTPEGWSRLSSASLAMGYELAVTPLQLAAAYAAIANGGELLEPALVREIRDPRGSVVYRHERRLVRRVVAPEIAREVRTMLGDVVQRGTGMQADLATFSVAGKTGTARRAADGSYAAGRYYASFVGLFPADEPQYVIVVKLDDPAREYGGLTAAPVTRAVLEAALAARDAALDRRALAAYELRRTSTAQLTHDSTSERATTGERDTGQVPVVVALDEPVQGAPRTPARIAVPSVRGLALRDAVAALHKAGLRVELASGPAGTTAPAAGSRVAPGTTVRLLHDDR